MTDAAKRRAILATTSAWKRGRLAGIAWIQTEGAADCTDAEVNDYAANLADINAPGSEADYATGFLAGVESMTVSSGKGG